MCLWDVLAPCSSGLRRHFPGNGEETLPCAQGCCPANPGSHDCPRSVAGLCSSSPAVLTNPSSSLFTHTPQRSGPGLPPPQFWGSPLQMYPPPPGFVWSSWQVPGTDYLQWAWPGLARAGGSFLWGRGAQLSYGFTLRPWAGQRHPRWQRPPLVSRRQGHALGHNLWVASGWLLALTAAL
jgi:hypothetical protein